jgi:hypothetical protein
MDTRRVKAALFGLAIGICGTWMLADSGQDNRAKFTSESQRVEILPPAAVEGWRSPYIERAEPFPSSRRKPSGLDI